MTDSPPPLPFDSAFVQGRVGHTVALGLRYVSHGHDWVELALDYDRRLISDLASGILASGPIVSTFDSALALAVAVKNEQMPHVTLDLRVDYLRPARPGETVVVRAECYKLTRRIAFARGFAHDGDPERPIAHATATFMLREEEEGA